MNCNEWRELTIADKIQMVGKACHLIQNETWFFILINHHIQQAERMGKFDEIVINPNIHTDETK